MAHPVVFLPVGASRVLALVIAVVHLSGALALFAAGLPAGLAAAGALLLAVQALHQIRSSALQAGARGIAALELRATTQVRLIHHDGEFSQWHLSGAPIVARSAVLIQLRNAEGERRHLWVMSDACTEAGHRRLRLILRWPGSSGLPTRAIA